jgi:oxygen-dependent protoporphyrinogen oxidase
VNPFVSGIYAGDPKELSIKHTFSMLWEMEQRYGSITKGMFRRERTNNHSRRAMISFQEGNQTLPIALANSLGQAVQTANIITSVEKVGNQWQVKGSKADGSFLGEHKCLVSTLPTHILSSVFESDLFNELSTLPYTPVSVLALGFKEHEVAHPLDGFGMLIPEIEHFKTLGVLFSSTLFPNRAPKGHALLTCFIGGARNPKLAQNSQKVLTKIVLNEIGPMLDISGTPVFCHHKFWPKGIPQYNLGHEHYLTAINKIEEQSHGLYLDGNFRNGVSVPDCISSGFETAKRVLTFL